MSPQIPNRKTQPKGGTWSESQPYDEAYFGLKSEVLREILRRVLPCNSNPGVFLRSRIKFAENSYEGLMILKKLLCFLVFGTAVTSYGMTNSYKEIIYTGTAITMVAFSNLVVADTFDDYCVPSNVSRIDEGICLTTVGMFAGLVMGFFSTHLIKEDIAPPTKWLDRHIFAGIVGAMVVGGLAVKEVVWAPWCK